jgi:hypothetical protein
MASREFRHRTRFVLRVTLLACCAIACATPQPPSREWQASFHLTGGFAGVDRSLDVASSGEVTASDRRAGKHASGRATARDLAQLSDLIAIATSPDVAAPSPCRDCFQYEITVRIDGKTTTARTNDISAGPLQPLVRALIGLLNRGLAGELAR